MEIDNGSEHNASMAMISRATGNLAKGNIALTDFFSDVTNVFDKQRMNSAPSQPV